VSADGPYSGDWTGIAEIDFAADRAAAMERYLASDDAFYSAIARAGGAMLGASSTGKLHAFDVGQQVSRCGLVLRPAATISTHRTDAEARAAGEDLCRVCGRAGTS